MTSPARKNRVTKPTTTNSTPNKGALKGAKTKFFSSHAGSGGVLRSRISLKKNRRSPWAGECNPGESKPNGSYFAGRNATWIMKATPATG